MAKGFLLGEEMPLQQDIQPLTIDDVSFTPIKASIPAREVELKELAPSTDFFIFPQASGSQTDGSGERIGNGRHKAVCVIPRYGTVSGKRRFSAMPKHFPEQGQRLS
jgi:hypothetical protein